MAAANSAGSAAWAAVRADHDSMSTRVPTRSATGRCRLVRCQRNAAAIGATGSAISTAPASGPDPVAVRISPMASSTRIASRTLARDTPYRSASTRSPGNRPPTPNRSAARSASIRASTSW